ncbi:MAG: hypothetical protein Q9227_005445 [Pyrenula ochraceoflavens]
MAHGIGRKRAPASLPSPVSLPSPNTDGRDDQGRPSCPSQYGHGNKHEISGAPADFLESEPSIYSRRASPVKVLGYFEDSESSTLALIRKFLPSPSYTGDSIRGISLAYIRNTCDNTADYLASICTNLNSKGSLIRVQHLCFTGLRSHYEGDTNAFWEALGNATLVAQRIRLPKDIPKPTCGHVNELEEEMRRRTVCNLYIWDR